MQFRSTFASLIRVFLRESSGLTGFLRAFFDRCYSTLTLKVLNSRGNVISPVNVTVSQRCIVFRKSRLAKSDMPPNLRTYTKTSIIFLLTSMWMLIWIRIWIRNHHLRLRSCPQHPLPNKHLISWRLENQSHGGQLLFRRRESRKTSETGENGAEKKLQHQNAIQI